MAFRTHITTLLLTLVATGCSQGEKKPRLAEQRVVGTWTSDTTRAADGTLRTYELRMQSTGLAELHRAEASGTPVIERGTWDGADSLVRVVVRGDGSGSRPMSLLFAFRGRTGLSLVNYDTTTWGAAGLTLVRQRADSSAPTR